MITFNSYMGVLTTSTTLHSLVQVFSVLLSFIFLTRSYDWEGNAWYFDYIFYVTFAHFGAVKLKTLNAAYPKVPSSSPPPFYSQ